MTAGRTSVALAVMLASLGCASASGPNIPDRDVESLRRTLTLGAPFNHGVSYLRAGDALGPRVILVHGTPGSGKSWGEYLLDPPAGVEMLALDRPGFGMSGPQDAVTSLAAQAAAVIALLPADGRRAILVGHSSGGPIVAWVAAQHPARVAALVLLAASTDPQLESIHPMQYVGALWPISALLPRTIRNSNAELIALKPELQALETMLAKVSAPTFILHGTADPLVPLANVEHQRKHLTGARCLEVVTLLGVNHFRPWNSQNAVRAAIRWAIDAAC